MQYQTLGARNTRRSQLLGMGDSLSQEGRDELLVLNFEARAASDREAQRFGELFRRFRSEAMSRRELHEFGRLLLAYALRSK